MARLHSNKPLPPDDRGGSSPFDKVRRTDAYGREYWDGREMQPLMGYSQWRDYANVIKKARDSLALVQGEEAAQHHFAETRNLVAIGSGAHRDAQTFRLTRFGAYLAAMAGDDTKEAVARARIYFAVRTREAELGAITLAEVRQTALARAREMVDYRIFRDMMADNAPDYEPSSRTTCMFFAAMQNKLYLNVVGMTAEEIKRARTLATWPGIDDGKPEPSAKSSARKIAKNYLTARELQKLNRLVGRLCLRAEDIADDGLHLSLTQWRDLVEVELVMATRQIAA
ncbi:RhuM family protein [Streptomyces sp. NPDC058424]|uniref:RhuM family protein n=1 Tax=Streptomyces sp. NPDC058424 TaxID=3346491 RepID=UPI0036673F77